MAETVHSEAAKLVRSAESVAALGSDMFGDKVNLYNGTVEFVHNDFSIPGHAALSMGVSRRLTTGNTQAPLGAFGDWDLEIPRLQGVFSAAAGWTQPGSGAAMYQRCSQFGAPPWVYGLSSVGVFNAEEYWHGHSLYVPGAGAQEVLQRIPGNPAPTTGGFNWPLVTKGRWALRCGTPLQRGTGEGFTAISPDGTQYRFDWMVSRPYAPLTKSNPLPQRQSGLEATLAESSDGGVIERPTADAGGPVDKPAGYFLQRVEVRILPTLLTDRFGNQVRYVYDPANPTRLLRIEGDDPSGSMRVITFTYDPATGFIASASDGARTWQYSYNLTTASLSTVTRPDGSQWQFNMHPIVVAGPLSQGGGACDGDAEFTQAPATGSMTHPSGAEGSFTLTPTQHARAGVQQSCVGEPGSDYNRYPVFIDAFSITEKGITGLGLLPANWTYRYSAAAPSFAPCNGCVQTKTVDVRDPREVTTRYTFGTLYQVNDGQLLRVDEAWDGINADRATVHEYKPSGDGAYSDYLGVTIQPRTYGDLSQRNTPEQRKVIHQQGASFTWQALSFDSFARPVQVRRWSVLNAGRIEQTTYFDHPGLWVLGQVATVTELSTGKVMESRGYDLGTANLLSHDRFGIRQQSFVYNADGTLERRRDGAGNTTSFGYYKRGLARHVQYADGTLECEGPGVRSCLLPSTAATSSDVPSPPPRIPERDLPRHLAR